MDLLVVKVLEGQGLQGGNLGRKGLDIYYRLGLDLLNLTKGGGSLGLTGLGKIAGITGLSGLAGLL